MKFAKRIFTFIREVKTELEKVSWSTKEELKGATVVVIVMTGIMALYIGAIDLLLSRFLTWLLR